MPVTSTIIQTKDNVYGNNNSVEYNPMAISGLSKLVICNTVNGVYEKKLYISGINYQDLTEFVKTGFDLVFTHTTQISSFTKFNINDDNRWNTIPIKTELSTYHYNLIANKIYKCRYVDGNFMIYNISDSSFVNLKYINYSQYPFYIPLNIWDVSNYADYYILSLNDFNIHLNVITQNQANVYYRMDGTNNDGIIYIEKLIMINYEEFYLKINITSGNNTCYIYGLKNAMKDAVNNIIPWKNEEFIALDTLPSYPSIKAVDIPRVGNFSIASCATEVKTWNNL